MMSYEGYREEDDGNDWIYYLQAGLVGWFTIEYFFRSFNNLPSNLKYILLRQV